MGCLGLLLVYFGFATLVNRGNTELAIALLLFGAIFTVLGFRSPSRSAPSTTSDSSTAPPSRREPTAGPAAAPVRRPPPKPRPKPKAPLRPREAVVPAIEINDDFRSALRVIEQQASSAFVTGRAGTGKSTLLTYFRARTSRQAVVLAPTGIAAVNVGGQTIHSFFRFPPRLIEPQKLRPSRHARLFRELQTMIIDEVSMVRADLLDGIDRALRLNRGRLGEPFGGVQVVMFGDPYQLPPIVKEADLRTYFERHYGGHFFFHAPVLKERPLPLIELKRVYRQTDPEFINLLNAVRENRLEGNIMTVLNRRVNPLSALRERSSYVTLTPTNQAAYEINMAFLESLPVPEFAFDAAVAGKFERSAYPADETLRLRRGARVMLLRNDPGKRWVNGTLATIADLHSDGVSVEIDGARYELEPATWENIEYSYDHQEHRIVERVVGTFRQYPIRLAWALTIHKSQGQTFDRVYIDFGAGAFAHGQAYVALSRCRTLDGLALARPLLETDVILDPASLGYVNVFRYLN